MCDILPVIEALQLNPSHIDIKDARKLCLHRQALLTRNGFGRGPSATLAAIKQLGYVQLDTLTVVARAHEHTLWNRLSAFRPSHIEQLQVEGELFEHWSHALSLLPMESYRYALPLMQRVAAGKVHWYKKDKQETAKVLGRIRDEGPLSSKDFQDKPEQQAMWSRSPSKRALEQLFMEGELMIPFRRGFQKVYDLRERVLPDWVDTSTPNSSEFARNLINSHLQAHGFGAAKEIAYLRKGMGAAVKQTLLEMAEADEVMPVMVSGRLYYCQPDLLELADQALPRAGFRILSPFDNAIIQRRRTLELFDFDYQIECYVRKENRKFGYFCLPLLFRNRLVGRLDAKADRASGTLQLLHLQLDAQSGDRESFYLSFLPELRRFASFNGCKNLQLRRISGCSIGAHRLRDFAGC